MKFKLSPRASLVIIAAMFVLPLALAWMMYSGAIDYRPGSTRNLGELVRPAVPIDWSATIRAAADPRDQGEGPLQDLDKHWVVLHVVPTPCDDGCIEAATALRQVHRASGRNQSRIRLALLLPGGEANDRSAELPDVYEQFHLLENPDGELRQAMNTVGDRTGVLSVPGASYLVDPLGNIMLAYAAGSDPNHLKKDLKRLLTWSKLDESS
ncbi:MAG: hypothetical protein HKP03_10670 [Xanthomonadales bacterium]|nr:hypothetical protein [Gammaproteobacteria bacterium]NNK38932.1 hypothetical protein [Xanthomonadales bacterium]